MLAGDPLGPVMTAPRQASVFTALALALALTGCGSSDAGGGTEGTEDTGASTGATTGPAGETTTAPGTTAVTNGYATGATTAVDGSTTDADPFCGDGNLDADEQCDDGNDDPFDGCNDACQIIAPLDPPALEWTYFEIEGTQCLDGSTAGFGVNENPASSNVMIYLEGGGACFNDSCDFTSFNIPFTSPTDGIFSRDNDANPVRDWTMIYVPYCTGDIHAGDAEGELGGQMRYFKGYRNLTRYLQTWVLSFPAERVLLTGISAGGFGAGINATQVADAYGDEVQLTVIDDSGPPLSNDVIPPCLQQQFRQTWNLDGTALAACPTCDPNDFATDLLDYTLQEYPNVQFGLFSNTADLIIRTYMGAGWGNGMFDNCTGLSTPVPIGVYADGLDAIRMGHEAQASTFYVTGLGHTALRVGFNVTFAGGTSLPEWLGDVLDGQIVHVGP